MAAAIAVGAEVIVTFNLKDFTIPAQNRYGIRASHPDDFLVNLIRKETEKAVEVIRILRSKLVRPSFSSTELMSIYHRADLSQFAAALAPYADQL